MKRLIFALSAFLALPAGGWCGASSFGEFAGTEPSVRAAGMANAYTASDGDVMGLFYNPAQTTEARTAGAMLQRGYADDSTGVLALTLPQPAPGVSLGLALLYYTAGDIDLYNSSGVKSTVEAEKDYLAALSLSRQFGTNYRAGISIKAAHVDMFNSANASTLLFDAGTRAKYRLADIGFAVQNLAGRLKLGSETETIPVTWRLGAARGWPCGGDALNANFDLVKVSKEPVYARLGGEYSFDGQIALRAGYEFKNELSASGGMNFGVGLKLENWAADYALTPYKDAGTVHRFALSCKL